MNTETAAEEFLEKFCSRNPGQPKFFRAVQDVVRTVMPVYLENTDYTQARVLERLTEPDRIIQFRVSWIDDSGTLRINRAWRVQHNNSIGPYKGGLRFHGELTEDALKFLAFEQTLKNSLTGLPLGGAKGGSNFDPRGKSRDEVLRFCQSLMVELYRYIGDDVDVPAGDMGVGEREIGFLFGQYMRLSNAWSGVLTGKGCTFGGSAGRQEATGHGCVHFGQHVLKHAGLDLEGMRLAISGSGTVATYAAEKAIDVGAKVVTMSDSKGFVHFESGLTKDSLDDLIRAKHEHRRSLEEFASDQDGVEYFSGKKSWSVQCDAAMPCATEDELDQEDAERLIGNGVKLVCEGANMPCTAAAERLFRESSVLYAPGKAANAGGVAVSGMELTQNAMRTSWTRDRVDEQLRQTMRSIHESCLEHGSNGSEADYVRGANLAGFLRVADTLVAYGVT